MYHNLFVNFDNLLKIEAEEETAAPKKVQRKPLKEGVGDQGYRYLVKGWQTQGITHAWKEWVTR